MFLLQVSTYSLNSCKDVMLHQVVYEYHLKMQKHNLPVKTDSGFCDVSNVS